MLTPEAEALLDSLVDERRATARTYLAGPAGLPVGGSSGAMVVDEYGTPYLDFGPGGAANILGYGNERILDTIRQHLYQYIYTGEGHLTRAATDYAAALSATFPEVDGRARQVLVLSCLEEALALARRVAPTLFHVSGDNPGDFGRTGSLWVERDLDDCAVVLGPAGGGGLPFAAVVAPPGWLDGILIPSMSNHPLTCAVAKAVLDQVTPELLAHVTSAGNVLATGLQELAAQFPNIVQPSPSGVGLLQKLTTTEQVDRPKFREACQAKGLLMHPDFTLTPPLVIDEVEVRQAIDIIADVCLDWS